jgi:hypothetical protein
MKSIPKNEIYSSRNRFFQSIPKSEKIESWDRFHEGNLFHSE